MNIIRDKRLGQANNAKIYEKKNQNLKFKK